MSKRKPLNGKERLRIFLLHGGVCHICGGKIHHERGEAWDISHVIPLAIGGDDDDVNRMPAHRKCHRVRTAEQDIPLIAKANRIRAKHIGATTPSSRPMPCGRNSRWRKKMNGEVVPRETARTVVKAYRPHRP